MPEYDFFKETAAAAAAHRTIPFWSWNGKLEAGELGVLR